MIRIVCLVLCNAFIGWMTGCHPPGHPPLNTSQFQIMVDSVDWMLDYRRFCRNSITRYEDSTGKSWQDDNDIYLAFQKDSQWNWVLMNTNNNRFGISCLINKSGLAINPELESKDSELANHLATAMLLAGDYTYNGRTDMRKDSFEYCARVNADKSVSVWIMPAFEYDAMQNKGGGFFMQFDSSFALMQRIILPGIDDINYEYPCFSIYTHDSFPTLPALYIARFYGDNVSQTVILDRWHKSIYTRNEKKWRHIPRRR